VSIFFRSIPVIRVVCMSQLAASSPSCAIPLVSAASSSSPSSSAAARYTPKHDAAEHRLGARQFAMAAALANVGAKILLHPLDTLKARMQAHPFGELRAFNSLWNVRGLYRGLLPKLVLSTPYQTAYMFAYRHVRDATMPALGATGAYLFAATVAEILSATIRVPMQVAKIRLQVDVHPNSISAGRAFVRNPWGTYSFFTIQTLFHDIPYGMIHWIAYENLRQRLFRDRDKDSLAPLEGMGCGSLAGATAAIATNPMEVVRTRVIAHTSPTGTCQGLAACVRLMYHTEGVRGFYRGLGPRVLWISSSMGVYFGLLEVCKTLIADSWPASDPTTGH